MPTTPTKPIHVVFDLGGVLLDWNPRYLYRKLLDDEDAMEHFLATVCTPEWNAQQDAGRTFAEATAILAAQFPEYTDLIRAYYDRWTEMLDGPIVETVEVLATLRERGVPLYALTNWSAEAFPYARANYGFMD
jgi:2-haloacid dehalogenase